APPQRTALDPGDQRRPGGVARPRPRHGHAGRGDRAVGRGLRRGGPPRSALTGPLVVDTHNMSRMIRLGPAVPPNRIARWAGAGRSALFGLVGVLQQPRSLAR